MKNIIATNALTALIGFSIITLVVLFVGAR